MIEYQMGLDPFASQSRIGKPALGTAILVDTDRRVAVRAHINISDAAFPVEFRRRTANHFSPAVIAHRRDFFQSHSSLSCSGLAAFFAGFGPCRKVNGLCRRE